MIDIEQLRADMEAGTQGPWHYRPQEFDDWGYVRGSDLGDGWGPFICQAKAPTSEEFENECRRTGQDPWGANARRIARLPDLEQAYLDLHENCAEYLKEGETPAERLASNHREILTLMKLLGKEKRHAEAWVKAAREAEAKLAQQGDQIEDLQADLRAAQQREADANKKAMKHLRRAEKSEIAAVNYANFSHEWRQRAEKAEAERDALREQNRKLREALLKLCNEVSGMEAFELELRDVMSNTNWGVLMLRRNEARAALAEGGEG